MAKHAQLPDGTLLEFPDETDDSVMDRVVKQHLGIAQEQPPVEESYGKRLLKTGTQALSAGADFFAPLNLVAGGLKEAPRLLFPESMGGADLETVSKNITENYEGLKPSSLLESVGIPKDYLQGQGYERFNQPMAALAEQTGKMGSAVLEKTGSPGLAAGVDVGAQLLVLGGAGKLGAKAAGKLEGKTKPAELSPEEFSELEKTVPEPIKQEAAPAPFKNDSSIMGTERGPVHHPWEYGDTLKDIPVEDVVSLSEKAKTYDPSTEAQSQLDFAKIEQEKAQRKALEEEAAWATKEEPPQPKQQSVNRGKFGQGGAVDLNVVVEAARKITDITKESLKTLGRLGIETKDDALNAAEALRERAAIKAEPKTMDSNVPRKEFLTFAERRMEAAAYKLEELAKKLPEERQVMGGVGKRGFKQGGAIGFGSKKVQKTASTYEDFAKRAVENGYSLDQAKTAWDRMQVGKQQQQTQAAIKKIPGLGGIEAIESKPYEEVKGRFAAEPDISKTPIENQVISGGRMKAAKTGSALINWAVEKIFATQREHEVIQKQAEKEVMSEVHRVKKTLGDAGLVEAVTQMQAVEGKALPGAKSKLAELIRTHMDALHKAVEEVSGKKRTYRPNYLAASFSGPYRSIVKAMHEGKETTIGVVAGKTMDDARAGVAYFRQLMPELKIEDPKFSQAYKKSQFGKKMDELIIHNNELMESAGDNPVALKFLEEADKFYAKKMAKHLEYYQHFKAKKGVVGAEGGAPWRNAVDNANDLINAQLKVLEDGWEWVAAKKASTEIRKILMDPALDGKENAKNYIGDYFSRAFHKDTKRLDVLSDVSEYLAEQAGVSPQVFSEASGLLRNFTLVNTLGWNPAFWVTQIAQVPQALTTTLSFLKENGVGMGEGKLKDMLTIGMYDAAQGMVGKFSHLSDAGKFFHTHALKKGIYDPHIVEHMRVGKWIPTTGMSNFKRFTVDNMLNAPHKATSVYTKWLGKVSIEMLEARTRSSYYMSVAHYLHNSGYSLADAASMADKLTSSFFVDYHPTERPALWNSLGGIGKFASTVHTYQFNYLNQIGMMAKQHKYKTLAAMAASMWFLTGLQGMPGVDDIDSLFNTVTNGRVSPKAYLYENTNSLLYYGATSEATGAALQTKFSQARVLPESSADFVWPLLSYWVNGFDKTATALKQRTPEAAGAALQAGLPGMTKSLPEKFLLTNKDKLTYNPNKLPKELQGYPRETKDWVARLAGTYSNDEYRAREAARMASRQLQYADKQVQSKIESMLYGLLAGDDNWTDKLQEAIDLGASPASIESAIESLSVNKQIGLKAQQQIKRGSVQSAPKQEIYENYTQ